MKLQIKIIKYVSLMALLLAFGTYAVTLNIEVGFIELSTLWLSNNFALTVLGGAFASMLVVLLCEIQKYHEIKRKTEKDIINYSLAELIRLGLLQKQIGELLVKPDGLVPKGILSFATESLKEEINALLKIEHCTFRSRNKLQEKLSNFCNQTAREIQEYIIYENYLTIAINTDQVNYFMEHGVEGRITAGSPLTNSILRKYQSMIDSYIPAVSAFSQFAASECKKHIKQYITEELQQDKKRFTFFDFEEFLKK